MTTADVRATSIGRQHRLLVLPAHRDAAFAS